MEAKQKNEFEWQSTQHNFPEQFVYALLTAQCVHRQGLDLLFYYYFVDVNQSEEEIIAQNNEHHHYYDHHIIN